MNSRISMKGISGRALPVWLTILACFIFVTVLCVPGLTAKVINPDKEKAVDLERVEGGPMMRAEFGGVQPEDIMFSGNIHSISVNARDNKYECQTLLTLYRDGTGNEYRILLYTISPELQSLFEVSFTEGKGIKVWGTEIAQQMEFDGKTYPSYRITRAMI